MPYLSALEVRSRQGAIQIHVYLTLPYLTTTTTTTTTTAAAATANKQPMVCEAQLAAELYKHILRWPINPVS